MSLPSLATPEQFEARYGASVDDGIRLQALLDDASALTREAAGADYIDVAEALTAVPQIMIAVVCEAVRRAYDNPAGFEGETIGDYTWRGGRTSGSGVYLTNDERRRIRLAAGKSTAVSVALNSLYPATRSASSSTDESDF